MKRRAAADWRDLAYVFAAAVVAALALIAAVKLIAHGDKATGALMAVLGLFAAIPALWLAVHKYREGDR